MIEIDEWLALMLELSVSYLLLVIVGVGVNDDGYAIERGWFDGFFQSMSTPLKKKPISDDVLSSL